MLLNGTELVDRHNRASVGSRVALRILFMNNGALIDPYDVSACTVFPKLANASPSSLLDSDTGVLDSYSSLSGSVNMCFGISGDPGGGNPHDGDAFSNRVTSQNLDWVAPTLYTPDATASGIYRNDVGDYVAVLDGVVDLSGHYILDDVDGEEVRNTASSLQEYIDVWTVKLFKTSDYQIFINEFRLFNDVFTAVTEPLILTPSNRLRNKKISLGGSEDLVVSTEMTVGNKELTEATKNIIREYPIQDVQVKIDKVHHDSPNLPGRTSVLAFTSTGVRVTSDNTILYNLDTTTLAATLNAADVGGPVGDYILTVKYSFLGQTFVSKPFYFQIL